MSTKLAVSQYLSRARYRDSVPNGGAAAAVH